MTFDLVQLRWQQIRSVESSQLMAKENIELKQQIAQLKIKLSSAQNAKSGVKMDFLTRLQMQTASFCMKSKAEFTKLKQTYETDIKDLTIMKDKLSIAFEKMKSIVVEKNVEVDVLRQDLKKLEQQIITLTSALDDKDHQHQTHLNMLDIKNAKHKEEMKELKRINAQLEQDLKQSKDYSSELNKQKTILEISIQELEKHCNLLRTEVNSIEESARKDLHEAQESQRRMSEHYEKMIEEMATENQYLRQHVNDLEDQVGRGLIYLLLIADCI